MKEFIVDNYGSKQQLHFHQSGEEDSLVRGFLVPTIAHNNVSLCIASCKVCLVHSIHPCVKEKQKVVCIPWLSMN
jgi:hypothetical protein